VCDLEALASLAHKHRMPLIVDNTVATPMLVRPVDYGADIIVHSLTKFMGGHGTTLGGIIVDCGRFPWIANAAVTPCSRSRRVLSRPGVHRSLWRFCIYRPLPQRVSTHGGAVLSPMNAFLLLQGIETVAVRIDRHVENARKVAEFLRADARVESVNFAGFSDNPYYPWCKSIWAAEPAPS